MAFFSGWTGVALVSVAILYLWKSGALSGLNKLLGTGGELAGQAAEGLSYTVELAEEGIGLGVTWAAEQYYFNPGGNAEAIQEMEAVGLTGLGMLDMIEHAEAGSGAFRYLPQFVRDYFTWENGAQFFMDLAQEFTGQSDWATFSDWLNAQAMIIIEGSTQE